MFVITTKQSPNKYHKNFRWQLRKEASHELSLILVIF